MYAEVYKWLTETSCLGLMDQAARLRHPTQAAKESYIAGLIWLWQENVSRLARQGGEYQLNVACKKLALKQMLVGKLKDNIEQWQAGTISFE